MRNVKDITAKLNTARMALPNNEVVLEREDVEHILYGAGMPKNSKMVSECIKFGIIEKRRNNQYVLPSKPIYYQKVGNAIDAYHRKCNVTAALYRARLERDVENYTEFLSKQGYKVIGA